MSAPTALIRTYGMEERSDTIDFFIRDERGRPPITQPRRERRSDPSAIGFLPTLPVWFQHYNERQTIEMV